MTKSVTVENSTTSTQAAHFFYDAQSRPALMRINISGVITYFRYVHNLQGDVIAILDANGNAVVEYKYDAWGKPTSITGAQKDNLGKLNPFRYRGYVWDEEAEFYYLRSRYYGVCFNRFVNEDIFLGLNEKILSHNAYSYCLNNCISFNDPDGCLFERTAGGGWGIGLGNGQISVGGSCGSGSGLATGAIAAAAAGTILYVNQDFLIKINASEYRGNSTTEDQIYTVYFLGDKETKVIKYVGRTKNLERRMSAHQARTSRTRDLIPIMKIDNLTKEEARGIEQEGMLYFQTLRSVNPDGFNLINGISKTNLKQEIYMIAGRGLWNYMENFISNEYHCLLEGGI